MYRWPKLAIAVADRLRAFTEDHPSLRGNTRCENEIALVVAGSETRWPLSRIAYVIRGLE